MGPVVRGASLPATVIVALFLVGCGSSVAVSGEGGGGGVAGAVPTGPDPDPDPCASVDFASCCEQKGCEQVEVRIVYEGEGVTTRNEPKCVSENRLCYRSGNCTSPHTPFDEACPSGYECVHFSVGCPTTCNYWGGEFAGHTVGYCLWPGGG